MDPVQYEIAYRIEHRHRDGSWGEMIENRAHHAPADHDPERGWAKGARIFRCTSCDEDVTLLPPDEASPPDR